MNVLESFFLCVCLIFSPVSESMWKFCELQITLFWFEKWFCFEINTTTNSIWVLFVGKKKCMNKQRFTCYHRTQYITVNFKMVRWIYDTLLYSLWTLFQIRCGLQKHQLLFFWFLFFGSFNCLPFKIDMRGWKYRATLTTTRNSMFLIVFFFKSSIDWIWKTSKQTHTLLIILGKKNYDDIFLKFSHSTKP